MKKPPFAFTLLLGVAAMAGCGLLLYGVKPVYGIAAALLALALLVAAALVRGAYGREMTRVMDDVFSANQGATRDIVANVDVPAMLFDEHGAVIWANHAMQELYSGSDVRRLLPNLELPIPQKSMALEYNGCSFSISNMHVRRDGSQAGNVTFQYWTDRTEALHYSRLYEEQMPTVALIYIDNYDELASDEQFRRHSVLAEVEKQVQAFVRSIDGVYRRYENAKFFVVFENSRLAELEKKRFPLLDAVHAIETGTNQFVTLSMAVGAADRIARSDEAARESMELALGRGGDQAVVKAAGSYAFYGGNRTVTTKNSRVKIRLFAKALKQLLDYADQVLVMGHRHADMDCLGATLGIMRCAAHVGCRAYMVLDEPNNTIQAALDAMRANAQYRDRIITPEQAHSLLRGGTVLVVVDTQRATMIMDPTLYERAGKTVIIDHHRRPVDAVANPTLSHLEAGASSTCEMVTEIIQYFDENVRPTTFECGALLTGITLDTKRFAFNTGARTFEAASYLRRNGADNSVVKLLFQDDMTVYRDRTRVVQAALIMEKGIAISTCPDGMADPALIAAQAADELITIKDIQTAFVLALVEGVVMISGRSTGEINVQLVLEKLGGGGHMTVAGAQLRGVTLDAAIEQLTGAIQTYLQEVK